MPRQLFQAIITKTQEIFRHLVERWYPCSFCYHLFCVSLCLQCNTVPALEALPGPTSCWLSVYKLFSLKMSVWYSSTSPNQTLFVYPHTLLLCLYLNSNAEISYKVYFDPDHHGKKRSELWMVTLCNLTSTELLLGRVCSRAHNNVYAKFGIDQSNGHRVLAI